MLFIWVKSNTIHDTIFDIIHNIIHVGVSLLDCAMCPLVGALGGLWVATWRLDIQVRPTACYFLIFFR